MKNQPLGRFHYAWVVAAVAFWALLVSAGVRSAPGVFLVPLQTDTGWSRSWISFAIALNIATYGLMGPFAGACIARFGMRMTTAMGLATLAVGGAAAACLHTLWMFVFIWGLIVGSGTGLVALVLAAAVANRWFYEKRGLVSGVLTASTATGQLIFLPILAELATHQGWRSVTFVVAMAALLTIIPIYIFMRDRPSDVGLLAFGASPEDRESDLPLLMSKQNPIVHAFGTLRRCTRSRDFWLLSGSFFICGASTNGLIGTHFISACGDHGIAEVQAAGLLAAMGIFDLFGTSASGWLTDRVNPRILLFWYYGLRGLSLLFLPSALGLAFGGLSVFAIFYGLDWIATVPPTLKLTRDAFGVEEAPIVYGWVAAAHQLGAGFIAFAAGDIRVLTSSYSSAFIVSGALCAIAAVAVLGISQRGDQLSPREPNIVTSGV